MAEQLTIPMTTCDEECAHGDDVERDRWGRPVVEGVARQRVSTLAGMTSDTGGLIAWKSRMIVAGMTQAMWRESRRKDANLGDIAERAVEHAGGKDAATEGTTMHEHLTTYALDRDGFDWDVLDSNQAESVLQFGRALDEAGLTPVMAEQFAVGPTWAGTFDLGLVDRHGRYALGDIKTSAKSNDVRYPLKVATQTAAYARARRWCPVGGWLPTPEWADLLLISVPLDGGSASIYRIDRAAADYALDLALAVRAIRGRTDLLRPIGEEYSA